jgi:hypothetical protein
MPEASAVMQTQEPSRKVVSYFFFDAFSADLVVLPYRTEREKW